MQSQDNESAAPANKARWGQARRLDFLEFRLLWDGRVNRSDLADFFGVSMPQASADFAEYTRHAPANIEYDPSEKTFKAGQNFKPVRVSSSADAYFLQLLALHADGFGAGTSFIGWAPPYEIVVTPKRFVSGQMLITALRAIRTKNSLEIVYQSLSRPEPLRRWISPTAIVNDEYRWHMRAWCHVRNRFADFTFGRTIEIVQARKRDELIPQDLEWEEYVNIVVAPNPELSANQQRVAELDYGMTEGVLKIRCRRALLFYLLRRLRLDEDDTGSPKVRQLVLVNRAEIESLTGLSSLYAG